MGCPHKILLAPAFSGGEDGRARAALSACHRTVLFQRVGTQQERRRGLALLAAEFLYGWTDALGRRGQNRGKQKGEPTERWPAERLRNRLHSCDRQQLERADWQLSPDGRQAQGRQYSFYVLGRGVEENRSHHVRSRTGTLRASPRHQALGADRFSAARLTVILFWPGYFRRNSARNSRTTKSTAASLFRVCSSTL